MTEMKKGKPQRPVTQTLQRQGCGHGDNEEKEAAEWRSEILAATAICIR